MENKIVEFALEHGLNHLHKKIESGEFSNLASGFVHYKDMRECVNVEKNGVIQSEKELVENMTQQLYSFLFSNPVVFTFAMSKLKLKSAPVTVRDYSNIVIETIKYIKSFNISLQKEFKNGTPHHFYLIFSDPEQRKMLNDMIKVVDAFVPFFENAAKAESVCSDKFISASEFSRLITIFNGKMEQSLTVARNMIADWDTSGAVDNIVYDNLVDGFKEVSNAILKLAKEISESQKSTQNTPKTSVVVVSAEEQLRLQTIDQANYLYDELINDTMRDLQAQVPYSAKDMYAYFVGVKLEKFIKEHKMPLSKSTPLKQAQDVVSKLNGLFNYVSKISENSRVSIVYGNDMMQ